MITLIRSEKLDVPHGFSTRAGGVSTGDFAELNLGRKVGDDPKLVAENYRRFHQATGATSLALLDQVHGDAVIEVVPRSTDMEPIASADAMTTGARGVALCIGTADCLPILIHDVRASLIGAAHAGWRGADLRIGARTVERIQSRGGDPKSMRAVLGPCIRRCCYEVSEDLAARFAKQFGEQVVDRSHEHPHLDIALASKLALEAAGVPSGAIHDLELCTACEAERFFSHRRDRGHTGRMLAFISLP